ALFANFLRGGPSLALAAGAGLGAGPAKTLGVGGRVPVLAGRIIGVGAVVGGRRPQFQPEVLRLGQAGGLASVLRLVRILGGLGGLRAAVFVGHGESPPSCIQSAPVGQTIS